jgi:hypothetical protein
LKPTATIDIDPHEARGAVSALPRVDTRSAAQMGVYPSFGQQEQKCAGLLFWPLRHV